MTLEKLLSALTRLIPGVTASTAKIGLAVSGGPDSLALLLLAAQAFPGRSFAATVDHQLRPESADEAAYVGEICQQYQIPHTILTPENPITGNIQSEARAVRYALLQQWASAGNIDYIATAHHADDQLETLLMRLARGSGLDGLSGIRARNGNIIRPLLDYRKSELVAICHDAGLHPVDDLSNHKSDFDRVRMRQALQSFDRIDPVQATRSAAALAQAGEALDWAVTQEFEQHVTRHGDTVFLRAIGYPAEIERRLVLRCLALIDPDLMVRGAALQALLDGLRSFETRTIGNILCEGGLTWKFSPAPPRTRHWASNTEID